MTYQWTIPRYTAQRSKSEKFIDINSTHKILEAEQQFNELFVKYFITDFADISYENASFPELPISEYSTWQLLNYKLVCGMYFSD